jgi:hypothetical protein
VTDTWLLSEAAYGELRARFDRVKSTSNAVQWDCMEWFETAFGWYKNGMDHNNVVR